MNWSFSGINWLFIYCLYYSEFHNKIDTNDIITRVVQYDHTHSGSVLIPSILVMDVCPRVQGMLQGATLTTDGWYLIDIVS